MPAKLCGLAVAGVGALLVASEVNDYGKEIDKAKPRLEKFNTPDSDGDGLPDRLDPEPKDPEDF